MTLRVLACARSLLRTNNAQVPEWMCELEPLRSLLGGVLSCASAREAVATHASRLSMGLSHIRTWFLSVGSHLDAVERLSTASAGSQELPEFGAVAQRSCGGTVLLTAVLRWQKRNKTKKP